MQEKRSPFSKLNYTQPKEADSVMFSFSLLEQILYNNHLLISLTIAIACFIIVLAFCYCAIRSFCFNVTDLVNRCTETFQSINPTRIKQTKERLGNWGTATQVKAEISPDGNFSKLGHQFEISSSEDGTNDSYLEEISELSDEEACQVLETKVAMQQETLEKLKQEAERRNQRRLDEIKACQDAQRVRDENLRMNLEIKRKQVVLQVQQEREMQETKAKQLNEWIETLE